MEAVLAAQPGDNLLHVGDIKTLETEAPRADFCGRIRGQTSMPSLNSPEQRQPESPTADSCTQNVGGGGMPAGERPGVRAP